MRGENRSGCWCRAEPFLLIGKAMAARHLSRPPVMDLEFSLQVQHYRPCGVMVLPGERDPLDR